MLELSNDEVFVIGTFMTGFQLWKAAGRDGENRSQCTTLKLPSGIRNIATKANTKWL